MPSFERQPAFLAIVFVLLPFLAQPSTAQVEGRPVHVESERRRADEKARETEGRRPEGMGETSFEEVAKKNSTRR